MSEPSLLLTVQTYLQMYDHHSERQRWKVICDLDLLCMCSVASAMFSSCIPIDCSPPGSSVHGILQATILEWVVIPSSSRGSSHPRDWTRVSCVSCIGRRILYPLSHLEGFKCATGLSIRGPSNPVWGAPGKIHKWVAFRAEFWVTHYGQHILQPVGRS